MLVYLNEKSLGLFIWFLGRKVIGGDFLYYVYLMWKVIYYLRIYKNIIGGLIFEGVGG